MNAGGNRSAGASGEKAELLPNLLRLSRLGIVTMDVRTAYQLLPQIQGLVTSPRPVISEWAKQEDAWQNYFKSLPKVERFFQSRSQRVTDKNA